MPSNHKQGTLSSTANQNDSVPDSPLELHACNKLSIINQPLTDCLSSSSCLRSQSARERTMVSCGSGVEVSSPRLGEGRAEERGVRGATVSSSILRSWSDGELGQSPTRVRSSVMSVITVFLKIYVLVHSLRNTTVQTDPDSDIQSEHENSCSESFTHLLVVLPLLLCHLPLRFLPLLLQLLLLAPVLLLLPWQQTQDIQHTASTKGRLNCLQVDVLAGKRLQTSSLLMNTDKSNTCKSCSNYWCTILNVHVRCPHCVLK